MKVRQIYQEEIIAKNNNKHNFFAELLFSQKLPRQNNSLDLVILLSLIISLLISSNKNHVTNCIYFRRAKARFVSIDALKRL